MSRTRKAPSWGSRVTEFGSPCWRAHVASKRAVVAEWMATVPTGIGLVGGRNWKKKTTAASKRTHRTVVHAAVTTIVLAFPLMRWLVPNGGTGPCGHPAASALDTAVADPHTPQ